MGTQKKGHNETVLLSTKNIFNPDGKKIIALLSSIFLHNSTYEFSYSFKFSSDKLKKQKLDICDIFDLADRQEENIKPGIYKQTVEDDR